jgi:hypothetical protein
MALDYPRNNREFASKGMEMADLSCPWTPISSLLREIMYTRSRCLLFSTSKMVHSKHPLTFNSIEKRVHSKHHSSSIQLNLNMSDTNSQPFPATCRALVCPGPGLPLTVQTIPTPDAIPGSVIVRVLASNFEANTAQVPAGEVPRLTIPHSFCPWGQANWACRRRWIRYDCPSSRLAGHA